MIANAVETPLEGLMRRTALQLAFVSVLSTLPAWPAQQQNQPQQESSSKTQEQQPAQDSSQQGRPSQQGKSTYDPFPAEQDVEIGAYYLHKGDVDAAIARFQDAIRLRSNFAKPRLLLAGAYEKKGDKAAAVKYYKEYLQVLPDAPDAKKIQKKIEKLTSR